MQSRDMVRQCRISILTVEHFVIYTFLNQASHGNIARTGRYQGQDEFCGGIQSDGSNFAFNDTHIEIDKHSLGWYFALSELRAKSLTIAWALAVLVATAGWFYFIARAGWFIAHWLSR